MRFRSRTSLLLVYSILFFTASVSEVFAEVEYLPGIEWAEPPVVTPGRNDALPPSDAIVLFDGKDLSLWNHAESWTVTDGIATVGKKSIETKQSFGDCQVHLEWRMPADFGKSDGQSRGNSGIYFMPHHNKRTNQFGKYEIQILDSYQSKTYPDGQAGAIYRQKPPMVNAMRPPGQWNTFDVVFIAPVFDGDGSLKSPACITLFHNGTLTHHNFPLEGPTSFNKPPLYSQHKAKLPFGLQSHGNRVQFRNIWARELQDAAGQRVHPPQYRDRDTGKYWPAKKAEISK